MVSMVAGKLPYMTEAFLISSGNSSASCPAHPAVNTSAGLGSGCAVSGALAKTGLTAGVHNEDDESVRAAMAAVRSAEALVLASRLVVMRHGKVVEEGPAAEIFANPQNAYTRALFAAAFNLETAGDGVVAQ